MLRKLLFVGVVGLLPSLAMAVPQAGDWELRLDGHGASDKDFDNNSLGASAQVGYFFTDALQVNLRQGLSWDKVQGIGSDWSGSTGVGIDYEFQIGDQWRPYVGASLGYTYGDDVDESWVAGVEGGVKYYVNASTFVFGQIGYNWLLDDSASDGGFGYGLGIGFNF